MSRRRRNAARLAFADGMSLACRYHGQMEVLLACLDEQQGDAARQRALLAAARDLTAYYEGLLAYFRAQAAGRPS